jgi:hypothetical protein
MRFLLGFLLSVCASVSAAPLKWYLQDATFLDGGTATGWFFFDAASEVVGDYRIQVSGGNTETFPAFIYQNGAPNNTYAIYFGMFDRPFFLFSTDIGRDPFPQAFRQLRLAVVQPLTNEGGTVLLDLENDFAVECFNCAPFRLYAGGSLTTILRGGPGGEPDDDEDPDNGPGGGPSQIPEPSTLWLCSAALVFVAARRRFASRPGA